MHQGDLEVVLAWRNHPNVRDHMFTRHAISRQEHQAWFERSRSDARKHLLIYEASGVPLGFVSLGLGSHERVADWGFYAAPEAPKGTGQRMGRAALDHAFGLLALHKVCGRAIETNEASIRLHARLGFQLEGLLREQHFDGQNFRAVLCFGLLAREWTAGA
jgi:UDP-4-amino-4,6-dideoxy-N-acetyl-beta-L-altrosamine N-acetyltransferase